MVEQVLACNRGFSPGPEYTVAVIRPRRLKGIFNMITETRKQQEIDFHNMLREDAPQQRWTVEEEDRLRENPLWSNFRYYSIERKSIDLVENFLQARVPGRRVLDYCCGNGDDTVKLAKMGAAQVCGIDISDVGLDHGRNRAREEGVDNRAQFFLMDAENLDFPDNYFDVIKIYGCLHHLDLAKAYSELSRVLKPDGIAIATEALGHNPIIHLYRKKTPHLRTPWEVDHLIKKHKLIQARGYFGEVKPTFFHLLTLGAVPLRRTRLFQPALRALEALDAVLLKLPFIRYQAWQVVFTLSAPNKKSTPATPAAAASSC